MPVQVYIYETKTNLSKLIKRVIEGEEIIIARSGEPVAKLVPVTKKNITRKPVHSKIRYHFQMI